MGDLKDRKGNEISGPKEERFIRQWNGSGKGKGFVTEKRRRTIFLLACTKIMIYNKPHERVILFSMGNFVLAREEQAVFF